MTTGTHNNNAYIELLKTFAPRPIDSEEELLATQKVIDSLIDRGGELTADELDYLNVLGSLVYEYEQLHHEPIPDICGVELIKALLVENNFQPKDLLPIFKTESIVSEVLSEQRKLTDIEMRQIADFFKMSPDDFLG